MDGSARVTYPTGNLFIDHLSEASRQSLSSDLKRISLSQGERVYDPGEPIERVIFPIGSVVSVLTEMLDGSTVEVGFIGREGMTGLPIVLGSKTVRQRAIAQVPDSALSMSARSFDRCVKAEANLQSAALRYAQATLASLSHFAACNRLHPVNERCARWLLMAHDRVPADTFMLTHEFLSQMLGVRRAGVSVAASALQQAGFIEYNHGRILVRDRTGLEGVACECYESVEAEWRDIAGYSVSKSVGRLRDTILSSS